MSIIIIIIKTTQQMIQLDEHVHGLCEVRQKSQVEEKLTYCCHRFSHVVK